MKDIPKRNRSLHSRHKNTIAISGFHQTTGVAYNHKFVTIVNNYRLWTVLAIVAMRNKEHHEWDVKAAFIQVYLQKTGAWTSKRNSEIYISFMVHVSAKKYSRSKSDYAKVLLNNKIFIFHKTSIWKLPIRSLLLRSTSWIRRKYCNASCSEHANSCEHGNGTHLMKGERWREFDI